MALAVNVHQAYVLGLCMMMAMAAYHVAKKSTSTGTSLPANSSSKDPNVFLVACMGEGPRGHRFMETGPRQ